MVKQPQDNKIEFFGEPVGALGGILRFENE